MINRYFHRIDTRSGQWQYFSRPYNSWGKWASFTPLKQYLGLLLPFAFLLSFPAHQYWQNQNTLAENFAELQRKRQQLDHQSRLLAVLQQKAQRHLSQAMTTKLASIHQQIQSLAADLSLTHSQWQLQGTPGLELKIQGHFAEIQQFLTALLRQIPELALLSWHIRKNDETDNAETDGHSFIESSLSFRLQIDKE